VVPSLNIVATCSDRKSHPAVLRLRDFGGHTIGERFSAWRTAIRNAKAFRTTAAQLYQGGYWAIVRDLVPVAAAMGWRPQLWVSSAGYGVVHGTTTLVPYSATFAPGHEDSVARASDDAALTTWWHSATVGRSRLGRSITSIAADEPRSTILVIASPLYLSAMSHDLTTSTAEVRGRGGVFIVSSKIPTSHRSLADHWIASRGELQGTLGGALVSLHARAARRLLQLVKPGEFVEENVSAMTKKLEGEVTGEVKKRVSGAATSDEDVLRFIRSRLSVEPKATHTRLLRELRDSGQACEQGRFRRLFHQAKPSR
jgi:hypothetical protein